VIAPSVAGAVDGVGEPAGSLEAVGVAEAAGRRAAAGRGVKTYTLPERTTTRKAANPAHRPVRLRREGGGGGAGA
jgi:hypothetical protein